MGIGSDKGVVRLEEATQRPVLGVAVYNLAINLRGGIPDLT